MFETQNTDDADIPALWSPPRVVLPMAAEFEKVRGKSTSGGTHQWNTATTKCECEEVDCVHDRFDEQNEEGLCLLFSRDPASFRMTDEDYDKASDINQYLIYKNDDRLVLSWKWWRRKNHKLGGWINDLQAMWWAEMYPGYAAKKGYGPYWKWMT
jgi:hypothetical protein